MQDWWFVRFAWRDEATAMLGPHARVYRSREGDEGCAYVPLEARPARLPPNASLMRLACTLELPGASVGADAPWHYIVATDVLPEHEADFNAWYDTEHLPGLAAVPGTVRAARYLVEGEGQPRHHACYDLATLETFGSAPWLAVRATAWSSRVRPAFRHTRRTMYALVSA